MDKQQAYRVLAMLQANYPDSFRGMSKEAAQIKVELWADMFADEPFEVVAAAAKAFMATDTKGFMPAVGQIKEQIARMRQREDLTGMEAWSYVDRAIRNSTYGADEEFHRLPPEIQRAVGSPAQLREWALMDVDTVQSVVASNFQRSYRVRQERDKDYAKLPQNIKALISQVKIGMLEGGVEDVGTSGDQLDRADGLAQLDAGT